MCMLFARMKLSMYCRHNGDPYNEGLARISVRVGNFLLQILPKQTWGHCSDAYVYF